MRRSLITTLTLFFAAGAFAGEVGRWDLDEASGTTAADSVGTNDGTLNNMDDADWVAGVVGNALDFDGVDDYVDTGATATDLGIDGNSNRTVAFWCYTRSFNNGAPFVIGSNASDADMFCLRTQTRDEEWRLQFWGWPDSVVTIPGSKDAWMHVAMTHTTAAETWIYINGKLLGIWGNDWLTTDGTTGTLRFGIYPGGTDAYYHGMIDDVRVFDEALSQDAVRALLDEAPPEVLSAVANDPDQTDQALSAGDRVTIRFATATNEAREGETPTGTEMMSYFPVTSGADWGTSSAFALTWIDAKTLAVDVTTVGDCSLDVGDTISVAAAANILNAAGTSSPAAGSSAMLVGHWGLGSLPTASGSILREYWSTPVGNDYRVRTTMNPRDPDAVDENDVQFEGMPQGSSDNYNTRLRGYIHPTATDTYTFFMVSDDNAELWLSSDDSPYNMQLIAEENGYSSYDFDDTGNPPVSSAPIDLTAGGRYYVEVVHREGTGGDHLAVGWTSVGAIDERPILADKLEPARQTPAVVSAVASDPDNTDTVLSNGDAVLLTFDRDTEPTGRASGAGVTGTTMNTYFALSGGHTFGDASASYTLTWISPRTLQVTLDDITGATIDVGDMITPRPPMGVRVAGTTDGDPCVDTAQLDGDWGLDLGTILVAHWPLDETDGGVYTVTDATGHGHDATRGTAAVIDQPGKVGRCYEFDGTAESYVALTDTDPNHLGLSATASRTIAGWARGTIADQGDWAGVFGFNDGQQVDYTYFDIEVSSGDQYVVHARNWQQDILPYDEEWHHLAATFDETTQEVKTYLDGQLDGTFTAPTFSIVDYFQMARRQTNTNFVGYIDDVRVYSVALDATTIAGLLDLADLNALSAVADDPDNGDVIYEAGDTVTITFDAATNQSATVATTMTGAEMDTRFPITGKTWGAAASYSGAWTSPTTLVLTIVDPTGADVDIADVITVAAATNITDANGVHASADLTCPALVGDWGQTPLDALIVHYRLDETTGTLAADSSGNGNDGTLNGATFDTITQAGQLGEAALFDGLDDYVEGGVIAAMETMTEYTAMAWVRPNDTDTNGYGDPIISQESGGYGFQLTWQYDAASSPGGRFGVMGRGVQMTWTPRAYDNGAWYHVVARFDALTGETSIFVDGALANSSDNDFDPRANQPLMVSAHRNNDATTGRFLNATIDDVRVYGMAVTDAFIGVVYQTMQVSIAATDPDAAEDVSTPDDGVFTVTRTATDTGTMPAVDVTLDIAGTALDPNDATPDYSLAVSGGETLTYDGTGTTWTLTMGATVETVTITATPIDDTVPEPDETVVVTVLDGNDYVAAAPDTDTVTITDDDIPSAFDITTPADDEVQVALPVDFVWTRDPATLAATYTLTVATDAALTAIVFQDATIADPADASTTVTLQVTAADGLATDMQYYWTVTAVNDAGSVDATSGTFTFWTTDTIPPQVQSIRPADDAEIDEAVVITFTETVQWPGTPSTVFDVSVGGTTVGGTWTVDAAANSITFAPTSDFAYDTTYTVTITAAGLLDDPGGNELDGDGNGTAGDDYTYTFTTEVELTGIGMGEGCVPGSGRAPLAMLLATVAILALLRRRDAAPARATLHLVAVAALGLLAMGCGAGGYTVANADGASIAPESVASLSLYDYGSYSPPSKKKESGTELKWAPRGGLVMYLGTEADVDPRLTLGLFGRMLEDDAKRVELGLDITPSFADSGRTNLYTTISGDFVGFIGDGLLYWKAGGGVILETRGDTNYFLGVLEGGVGLWLAVGDENAALVNATFQIPLGDANPSMMFALTAGYEF